MFPTTASIILRNEAGEVTGWDDPDAYSDESGMMDDYEPPTPRDTVQCIVWGQHAQDGDGTDVEDVYECLSCGGLYRVDWENDGEVTDL